MIAADGTIDVRSSTGYEHGGVNVDQIDGVASFLLLTGVPNSSVLIARNVVDGWRRVAEVARLLACSTKVL